jgi:septum formation inhibitor-activating ATPase MinD
MYNNNIKKRKEMKSMRKTPLKSIRNKLANLGVVMTDDQFYSLSYLELKTIYKKSEKASVLYSEVANIITKEKIPTPKVEKEKEKVIIKK